MTAKTPTLFLPHGGGPCFFMEWTWGPKDMWERMAAWLRQVATQIGSTPKALLVISAHWEEDAFTATSGAAPSLIYDYFGFPEHTYQITYPAPGAPALAERVRGMLEAAGLPAAVNAERGFDHGVFVPLKLIFPDAQIPIVQLSLHKSLDPMVHLKAGHALAKLRDEGVFIIGSGMSYHNMRGFGGQPKAKAHSEAFDRWLTYAATAPTPKERAAALVRWATAPSARDSHPREEHLLPLMVVAGAGGTDVGAKVFTDEVLGVQVSAFQYG